MSGSTENRAGPSEKPAAKSAIFSLEIAQRMLPLVQQIVGDIVQNHRLLDQFAAEQRALDRDRRTLDWPRRQRRYQLRDDIAAAERTVQDALSELEGLGLALLIPQEGLVGFPTVVNGRKAYFSWKPNEETLRHWHFIGDSVRRKIPASWVESSDQRLISES